MSSTIRRGTSSKLSQNSSTIAAIMRLSATGPGRFSSRLIVQLRAGSSAHFGPPADRHLESRIGPQRVVIVLVAGGDQERPEADHLGEPVLDPMGPPRILDAARQALGNAEPALDLGEHQNAAV